MTSPTSPWWPCPHCGMPLDPRRCPDVTEAECVLCGAVVNLPKAYGWCPGSCNRSWRQAGYPKAPEPSYGEPIWCPPCSAGIAAALMALLELYVRLELDRDHGTRGGSEHVGGSRAPASPSPAGDEQDDLVRWLCSWEDTIRDLRGLSDRPQRGREERTLIGAHGFVLAHTPWALEQPDIAVDFGLEVIDTRRRLRTRTLSGAQRVRKRAPCPRCGLRTLVHEGGQTYVGCDNPACGRLLTLDEYDELAASVARSEAS